jgi:D-erythrose 4-phosphate dehydrogenase
MLNIAINGYGRIGRCVLRAFYEASLDNDTLGKTIAIVAINELADNKTIAHLTQYDSTHGKFARSVAINTDAADNDILCIDNDSIHIFHEENIEHLPWAKLNIDIVLECTGAFSDRKTAEKHILAGAKKVLFSQPAENDVDATIVYGVNEQTLTDDHIIISNASCTTNCIVPVIDTLHRAFGIESGVITTIHSAMNDQPIIDAYHDTDLRKTRGAYQSIIPVDTGLAKGIDRLLPELAGRFQAQAMRVPTANVSVIDLSVVVTQRVSAEKINAALKAAADKLPTILGYTEEPLASCDFNHDPRSGIVDASQTRVAGDTLVKVLTWFDNEWGFANRMLDVVRRLAP